ncbi:MAG: LysM peptidoglycan-binding domain-containing protein [Elusimicrobia bacterium]|nr:LysM peptidoglycan-binding domain-containing protein [Elusimicrobiota bacterium]
MRITNLHLIVSFLILSGVAFFLYQFYGRERVPVRPPPVEEEKPEEMAEKEEMERRLEEERARRETEREREEALNLAGEALSRAAGAIQRARVEGRDEGAAVQLYHKAKAALGQAKDVPEFGRVRDMALEAARMAEAAPAKERADEYVVKRGDNLWNIAKKREVYGRGAGWVRIWRANENKVPDFDILYSGITLEIPR